MWSLARLDWEERLLAGESLMPELPELDLVEARRARTIFNMLHVPDVEGEPSLAEAGGEWFREIVGAMFGCVIDERRMIRELFLLAPKKSAKTTYGAAFMLVALLLNHRPRAEFLLIAPTIVVADLAFSQAVGMIQCDPFGYLQRRFQVLDHKKIIRDRRTSAKLMIKTFDARVLTGVKPVGVLIDELHEISRNPAAAKVMRQLRGGLIANPEGFMAIITTQSDGPPIGVFAAELKKARMIRDGLAQSSTLPLLYEFPRRMVEERPGEVGAWRDPANWWMVTPNRGLSVQLERLEEEFRDTLLKGEEEVRGWASQHLNIEIGMALLANRWSGAAFWENAVDPKINSLRRIIKVSDVLAVGIDGGGLDDLLGLAVIGRDAKNPARWRIWGHAWVFDKVLELRKSEASKFEDFKMDQDLGIVSTLGDDIEELCDLCEEIDKSGKLAAVGLDPAGIGTIVDELAKRGITGEKKVIGIPQGWRMTGAVKTLERKLAAGMATHCGQRMMAWAVSNAKVEPKGNAIVITKQASGTGKIDPLMAVLDAVAIMSTNPEAPNNVSDFLKNAVISR